MSVYTPFDCSKWPYKFELWILLRVNCHVVCSVRIELLNDSHLLIQLHHNIIHTYMMRHFIVVLMIIGNIFFNKMYWLTSKGFNLYLHIVGRF